MMQTGKPRQQIVLAWPYEKNSKYNKYQDIVYSGMSPGFGFIEFSIKTLLFNKYTIFHYHWPETYLNHRNFLGALLGALFVLCAQLISKLKCSVNVWTVHNLAPHEGRHPRLTKIFYWFCYRLTDKFIFLTNYSFQETLRNHPYIAQRTRSTDIKIIYHPLYMPFTVLNKPIIDIPSAKYLLCFGLIRRYKNFPRLIEVFSQISPNHENYGLLVTGTSCDKDEVDLIKKLSQKNPRVVFNDKFISDNELGWLLQNCSGVVIPYDGLNNSGVLFQALAYCKPVLAPNSVYFREIKNSLDNQFLFLYDGQIDKAALDFFIDKSQNVQELFDNCLDPNLYNSSIIRSHRDFFSSV